MRKLSLAVILFFSQLVGAFAQSDSSAYKQRKLKIEEVNLVSSYYTQDGNNSAVTGGIGTEQLTDFANTIEIRMAKRDKKDRLHSLGFEMGIDHYTSASSDKIDPSTISSASRADTRFYPSLAWNVKNEPRHFTLGAVASYSTEFDYQSFGLGANIAKASKDNNREISLKLQSYFDHWTIIYPIELRPSPDRTQPRNSYSASLSFSQVVNKRLQFALLVDGIYQSGLLATRYQRVYFTDNSVRVENLPDNRMKFPIGIRGSYFAGNRVVFRGFYRFYTDDWGITAHTASIEMPVKINPFLSVSPFYRYYTQTAVDYFSPYKTHSTAETFYTSDYDLSSFQSHFAGIGLRFSPEHGVFGISRWASAEIRYGHYIRNTGLHSDIITLAAKFK